MSKEKKEHRESIVITFAPSDYRTLKSVRFEYTDADIHEFMAQVIVPMLMTIGYSQQTISDMCEGYLEENPCKEDEAK